MEENPFETPPTAPAESVPPTPQAQVEVIIDENRELFESVPTLWADAKAIQRDEYTENYRTILDDLASVILSVQSAQLGKTGQSAKPASRRQLQRSANTNTDQNLPFFMHQVAANASHIFREEYERNPDISHLELTERALEGSRKLEQGLGYKDWKTSVSPDKLFDEAQRESINRFAESNHTLTVAYTLGYLAQTRAMTVIDRILADDLLVFPFIQNFEKFAEQADAGDRIAGGLMQTIANHILEYRDTNHIRLAVERTSGDTAQARLEFATEFLLNDASRDVRKQALLQYTGIQALKDIVVDEYGIPFENLTATFADRMSKYPPLRDAFKAFMKKRTNSYLNKIKQHTQRFEKPGRILLSASQAGSNIIYDTFNGAQMGERRGRNMRAHGIELQSDDI